LILGGENLSEVYVMREDSELRKNIAETTKSNKFLKMLDTILEWVMAPFVIILCVVSFVQNNLILGILFSIVAVYEISKTIIRVMKKKRIK